MGKDGNPVFGVRVRQDLQDKIKARAKAEDMSVASWLAWVLGPVLEADPRPSVEQRLAAVERRLDALEGSETKIVGSGTERPLRASKGPSQGQDNRKPRSGPNRTPPETVARILELSDQGRTGGQIAAEVGLTREGVNRIIRRERDRAASDGP